MRRLPPNNRIHSDAAHVTHAIWTDTIGSVTPRPSSSGSSHTRSFSSGLNRKIDHNTSARCKKCGAAGHFAFQCRNDTQTVSDNSLNTLIPEPTVLNPSGTTLQDISLSHLQSQSKKRKHREDSSSSDSEHSHSHKHHKSSHHHKHDKTKKHKKGKEKKHKKHKEKSEDTHKEREKEKGKEKEKEMKQEDTLEKAQENKDPHHGEQNQNSSQDKNTHNSSEVKKSAEVSQSTHTTTSAAAVDNISSNTQTPLKDTSSTASVVSPPKETTPVT